MRSFGQESLAGDPAQVIGALNEIADWTSVSASFVYSIRLLHVLWDTGQSYRSTV